MRENYILVTSFKKMKYEDNKPTGRLYVNRSYVNVDNIAFITTAKTSIYKPQFNIDYYEEGSTIHLINGTTLTCNTEPKILVDHIYSIQNNK
jgi:hypothetical protein